MTQDCPMCQKCNVGRNQCRLIETSVRIGARAFAACGIVGIVHAYGVWSYKQRRDKCKSPLVTKEAHFREQAQTLFPTMFRLLWIWNILYN